MISKLRLISVCLLLLFSTMTLAAGKTDQEKVEQATAPLVDDDTADANKVVCKRVRQTGSHFRSRVCMKKLSWQRLREQDQAALRDIQKQNPQPAGS
jgi:hypothetical protein